MWSLNVIRGPIYVSTPSRDARDRRLDERMKARLTLENPLAKRVQDDPKYRSVTRPSG